MKRMKSSNPTVIRKEILDVQDRQKQSIRNSGTWWDGKERLFFAYQARTFLTGETTHLQKSEINGQKSSRLSAAKAVIASLAGNGKHITKKTMDNALNSGLSEAEYVELIGVTTRSICLDLFNKGLGLPYTNYEKPESSPPSQKLPRSLKNEGAWVQTVPAGQAGDIDGKELYGESQAPFIFRALSLVPEEAKEVMAITTNQYVPSEKLMRLDFSHTKEFDRSQIELVAGRTSLLNECFY